MAVDRLETADGIVDRHRAVLAAPGQDDLAGRERDAFGDDTCPRDAAAVCEGPLAEADEIVAALMEPPVTASHTAVGGEEPVVSAVEVMQLLRGTAPPLATGP